MDVEQGEYIHMEMDYTNFFFGVCNSVNMLRYEHCCSFKKEICR